MWSGDGDGATGTDGAFAAVDVESSLRINERRSLLMSAQANIAVESAERRTRRWKVVAGVAIGSVFLVGTTVASAVTGSVTTASPAPATNITSFTFCKDVDGTVHFVSATTACSKSQTRYNLTGVAGPQGPQGIQGLAGPAGPANP